MDIGILNTSKIETKQFTLTIACPSIPQQIVLVPPPSLTFTIDMNLASTYTVNLGQRIVTPINSADCNWIYSLKVLD